MLSPALSLALALVPVIDAAAPTEFVDEGTLLLAKPRRVR